jgi:WD40 repeat protein
MSKRLIYGESSPAANKRHAVTPEDEEDPLPSSSLAQQASPLSTLKAPLHLIGDLILPFVADRATWNSACSASKDLWLAGKKMTPPWPNKSFNLGRNVHVRYLAFSPCGSQLAFCNINKRTAQHVFHIWNRWGKETLLEGHTYVQCMEYSLDGEYLASGGGDGSVRIWHAESSLHATSSQAHMERPTRTPKQADTILSGGHFSTAALSFSRTDSNVLASGKQNGDINVWKIKERACIHSFFPDHVTIGVSISALFFAGGADIACLAAARTGSVIRLRRAEGSSDSSSETMGEADRGRTGLNTAVLSPSGSFLATSFISRADFELNSTLELYEFETMTKTQSVVMPGCNATTCVAVSPDSKQLVYGFSNGRIRLLQTDDFSIQRDLDTTGEANAISSVAFDPTCQVLAFGYADGRLELRSL